MNIAQPQSSRNWMSRRRWIPSAVLILMGMVTVLGILGRTSQAFGPTGHRVVGRVAETHLSGAAAAAVKELMGSETLPEAATWPDEIRSDSTLPNTGDFHFVTIEDGQTYETSTKNPNGDAIVKLQEFIGVLQRPSASKEDKVTALRWVVHLIGDLHQPLHVGRGADRGGNSIKTKWFGQDTNLHKIWDSEMIDSTQLSFSEIAEFINSPTPDQIAKWQGSTIRDWVQESLDYRQQVYTPPGPEAKDTYKYAYDNLPLVNLRLTQAGVRLAGVLNDIYSEPVAGPWPKMPNSLHWMRNSAEYKAAAFQTYTVAWTRLRGLKNANELPANGAWAVALDADETVLDNSLYSKEQRGSYSSATWKAWCEREESQAVPGAAEFLKYVHSLGGKIAIVSNRKLEVLVATKSNLTKLGIPFDVILLKDDTDEKEPRWQKISEGTASPDFPPLRIVMYFGDNITDFPDLDQAQRFKPAADFGTFGNHYFVLPNPAYGSFEANPRN